MTLEEAAQHLLSLSSSSATTSTSTTSKPVAEEPARKHQKQDEPLASPQSSRSLDEAALMMKSHPKDVLSIGKYVGALKHVPRTGWVLRKVPGRIESVAEHSFRAAVLGLLLNDDSLDIGRVVAIALVHDLAESIAGDIAPSQGISDEEKKKMEEDAMNTILGQLNAPSAHKKIMEMWHEYEDRKTPEGKAVKDLDRFEMVLQADEYESKHADLDLSEFFNSVRGKFTHPAVQRWFADLETRRNQRRSQLQTNNSALDSKI